MAIISKKPTPGGEDSILGQLASGSTGTAGGRVYMGQVSMMSGRSPAGLTEAAQANLSRRGRDLWVSESEAASDFYTWNVKKQRDFLASAVVGGLLKAGDGPMEAGKLWGKLVKEAAQYGRANKKVSPFDLMAAYTAAAGGAEKNAWRSAGAFEINIQTGERRYVGPGIYLGDGKAVQTDTRTDLTDPDTAKAVATKLFQDMMGRDPGAGELGAFAKALNTAEANSPVTQATTTTYDMETGQPIKQDTTSSGGISAEGKAYIGEQQIKKKKEYGVTQAATYYQNAFDQLVFGAPGS